MSFFKAEDISISFGGLKALNRVSFEISQGEVFGIIGPNGAGKSTILNCGSSPKRVGKNEPEIL
jgi:branched-chain amino acid transport system ATP-binding protein